MIYYLCYISTANIDFNEHMLQELLTKSRKNNQAVNVTGVLLYHDSSFIQYLEGDKQQVMELFERIKKDLRHRSVYKIVSGTSRDRKFTNWSMAFQHLTRKDILDITGYKSFDSKTLTQEFPLDDKHPGIVLLRSFMKSTLNNFNTAL